MALQDVMLQQARGNAAGSQQKSHGVSKNPAPGATTMQAVQNQQNTPGPSVQQTGPSGGQQMALNTQTLTFYGVIAADLLLLYIAMRV